MANNATQQLLLELAALKAQEEEIATRKEAISQQLVAELQRKGSKTTSITLDNGDKVKGTLVEAQRVKYDATRLKNACSQQTWKKVTKQVLDPELLEAAVALGAIDSALVAACATVDDVKPYIRVSGQYSPGMLIPNRPVSTTNSTGQTKPAARKRRGRKVRP